MLELLGATLPELRRGLGERAARTVAYELFEKLGFGAVAVSSSSTGASRRGRRLLGTAQALLTRTAVP